MHGKYLNKATTTSHPSLLLHNDLTARYIAVAVDTDTRTYGMEQQTPLTVSIPLRPPLADEDV
jgi:hypothetical protein